MKNLNTASPEKIAEVYELLDKYPQVADEMGYELKKLKRILMLMPEDQVDRFYGILKLKDKQE